MKYVLILFLLFMSLSFSVEASSSYTIESSSNENNNELKEVHAFDNNFQTRWSSQFSDTEWLQISFEEEVDIAGLEVYWEAAYAHQYQILTSQDGVNWEIAYDEKKGDGQVDRVYFPPRKAHFIRIQGVERATEWGYSIFEIKLIGKAFYPFLTTDLNLKDQEVKRILDGNLESGLALGKDGTLELTIDMKVENTLAGFELYWQKKIPGVIQLFGSVDSNEWTLIKKRVKQDAHYPASEKLLTETLWFKPIKTRYLRMKIASEKKLKELPVLQEIKFKFPTDKISPLEYYQSMARKNKEGLMPLWMRGQQYHWTTLGMPFEKKEVAVGEDGMVENDFSLNSFIYLDDKLLLPDRQEISRSLEDGYLPSTYIAWEKEGIRFRQNVKVIQVEKKSLALIRYEVVNQSEKIRDGKFYLTIRPFKVTPPWLYGKLAEINKIEYQEEQDTVFINEKPSVFLRQKPNGFQTFAYHQKSLLEKIEAGESLELDTEALIDKYNLASGLSCFDFFLEPKQTFTLHVALPIEKNISEISWERVLQRDLQNRWKEDLNRVSFTSGNSEWLNIMRYNLAQLLIAADGLYLHPGSRVYDRSYIRDSAMIATALLRVGHTDPVRSFIEVVAKKQEESGFIPFILTDTGIPSYAKNWTQLDSQGQFIFMVAEYYRFTGDVVFVNKMFPHVLRSLDYIQEERYAAKTKQEFKQGYDGILNKSNSHEGYFPAQHSYWDNLWALKGLKDAAFLSDKIKHPESKKIRKDFQNFQKTLYLSIQNTIKYHGIDYIPGCVEQGDFDIPATAVATFPLDIEDLIPKKFYANNFKKYLAEDVLLRKLGRGREAITGYEMQTLFYYLLHGETETFHHLLNEFVTFTRPQGWHQWPETIFRDRRQAGYLGDIPHGWVGSLFINTFRNMYLYERKNQLIFAAGIPDDWYLDQKPFAVSNAPTFFGEISYHVSFKENKMIIELSGNVLPKNGFQWILPKSMKFKTKTKNVKLQKNILSFQKMPKKIVLKITSS